MKRSTIVFGALASVLLICGIYAYSINNTSNETLSNAICPCSCNESCNCLCHTTGTVHEYHHADENEYYGMAYRHCHRYRHMGYGCEYHYNCTCDCNMQ
ncbi:hypothetical protein [Methanocaldococcus sp.]